ncbi:OmpH family outer membrane protein [Pistricoccus aurantiacus]|uniref:OmpH family outer membrane protein n=1 Tax=Pistricoccus aurantiacus TaxID=1883414 RepID=A0A5B8SNP4_9GAMM|nr:OmpH family outer membrane protein [Pistricoccus aurantiacus]QEA38792.1 OmpH family outer membrane protein [Pistricoccus aurantiacus]
MRKLTGALFFVCLLGSLGAQAAEVAVLDWRKALLDTQAAQRSMNQLKNQIAGQQQEAEALGKELQSLQERLQRDGATMSDAQRQSAQQEFQTKGQRFQQLRQQIAEARMRSEKTFLDQAQPKLERAVDQVIERHDIEVLADREGVIHTDIELLDVTEEVTEILNSLN